MKLEVYRKKTHTNQYLAFDTHHLLHQNRGVVRTLLNRLEKEVTEEDDKTIVKGFSERIAQLMKTRRISTAIPPHTTLINLLVHPKDIAEPSKGVITPEHGSCEDFIRQMGEIGDRGRRSDQRK